MFEVQKNKIEILANYHTHTKRCGHATGEDREYVEAAIKAGIKVLGFSDHTPYPTGTGYVSGMRIRLEDTDGYFDSITALREEYKKDIDIYVGVEAEYFPEHFQKLVEFMKDYPLDYMILGNHYVPDEENGIYMGNGFTDRTYLDEYVCNVIAGMQTGKFAYVAHPDLPNYVGPEKDRTLSEAYNRICKAAKELNIPLEINMLGHTRKIQYPSDLFFKIASEYDNDVIIGMDIHNPEHFSNKEAYKFCVELANKYGLNRLERLNITRRTK